MVAAVRALPRSVRAARRRRSTPPCTRSSRPATSTTCTPTRSSPWPRRRDGEALTRRSASAARWPGCRGGARASSSGLQIAALQRDNPGLRGVVLGGHGLTTWADTSDGLPGTVARGDPPGGAVHRRERWQPIRSARCARGFEPLAERGAPRGWPACWRRCSAGCARPTGAWSGRSTDSDLVLDFLAREARRRLAPLGTSCPDHFLRTKVRPLLLDLPPSERVDDVS